MTKALDEIKIGLISNNLKYEIRPDQEDILLTLGYCHQDNLMRIFNKCEKLHLSIFHSELGVFVIF